MSRTTHVVPCAEPFDLNLSLRFLEGFWPTKGEQEISFERGTVTKALRVVGQTVAFSVRQSSASALEVTLNSQASLTEEVQCRVLERARAFLGADEDLSDFYERARQDADFAPTALALRGLHHVRFLSAYESAVWGVINQRIPRERARGMKDELVRTFGGSQVVDEVRLGAFPEASEVLARGERALAEVLRHPRKAKAVWAVTEAFARVDPVFLSQAPLPRVEAWLREIYGVGDFTTGFVLFRGLGRFLSLPSSPGALRAATAVYGSAVSTVEEMHARSRPYGEWAGYWSLYLWAAGFCLDAATQPRARRRASVTKAAASTRGLAGR